MEIGKQKGVFYLNDIEHTFQRTVRKRGKVLQCCIAQRSNQEDVNSLDKGKPKKLVPSPIFFRKKNPILPY